MNEVIELCVLKSSQWHPCIDMTVAGIPQKHNALLQHPRTEATEETCGTSFIRNKAFCPSATSINMAITQQAFHCQQSVENGPFSNWLHSQFTLHFMELNEQASHSVLWNPLPNQKSHLAYDFSQFQTILLQNMYYK